MTVRDSTATDRWRASWCPEHHIGPDADFCTPCRVWAIQSAAEHLRDLAEGHDSDVVGDTMPTTLAEAVTELVAYAEAVKNGEIS